MRIRSILSLLLLSAYVSACGPAGEQPAFNTRVDPVATPLPTAKPGTLIAALAQRIVSFDVSPDAATIAVATTKGALLYDLRTRKLLRTLVDGELASSVAWSADGSKLAVGSTKDYGTPFFSGGDSTNSNKAHLTVWDTSTWKTVFEPQFGLEMVNQTFRDMAWSPDGRSLAFSLDLGGVQVLDTQTGQTISRQTDFAGTVVDISWSPDGSRLLATGDMAYGVRRWRVSDDTSVRLFDRRMSSSNSVAWSPDGKRIASSDYLGNVCLWSASTNRCDGFIHAHRTNAFGLAWSPDGARLATVGGVIRIWDVNTGKLLQALGEDDSYVYNRVEWPASGSLVTLQTGMESMGNTVLRVWDLSTGSMLAELRGVQPD